LLDECRTLQAQPGAVRYHRGRVMMADYLNPAPGVGSTVPVVEKEIARLQRLPHFNVSSQMPIMITGDDYHLTTFGEIAQELGCFPRRRFVMNQVAQNDQPAWFIFVDHLAEPLGNRRHPPHRDESASRALAQFITKMEVRHGEPALGLMEKRKPAIEKDISGDKRLVWAKRRHR
jgi:hypothetical protein